MGHWSTMILNGVFVVLFVGGCVFCWWCFTRIKRATDAVKDLENVLQKYSRDSLADNYGELQEEMAGCPYAEIWNKFERTLFKSDNEGIMMTQDPESFYNDQTLLEDIPLAIFHGMPGIFTGVGLLGTFLGLTVGLTNIDFNNIETMKSGIEGLLKGTTTAFWTSVVGLIFALAFTILSNIYCSRPYNRQGPA